VPKQRSQIQSTHSSSHFYVVHVCFGSNKVWLLKLLSVFFKIWDCYNFYLCTFVPGSHSLMSHNSVPNQHCQFRREFDYASTYCYFRGHEKAQSGMVMLFLSNMSVGTQQHMFNQLCNCLQDTYRVTVVTTDKIRGSNQGWFLYGCTECSCKAEGNEPLFVCKKGTRPMNLSSSMSPLQLYVFSFTLISLKV
jgi:hypothetical protein